MDWIIQLDKTQHATDPATRAKQGATIVPCRNRDTFQAGSTIAAMTTPGNIDFVTALFQTPAPQDLTIVGD